jgi:hypothetical protein
VIPVGVNRSVALRNVGELGEKMSDPENADEKGRPPDGRTVKLGRRVALGRTAPETGRVAVGENAHDGVANGVDLSHARQVGAVPVFTVLIGAPTFHLLSAPPAKLYCVELEKFDR